MTGTFHDKHNFKIYQVKNFLFTAFYCHPLPTHQHVLIVYGREIPAKSAKCGFRSAEHSTFSQPLQLLVL